jgi:CHAD domain-containing protein
MAKAPRYGNAGPDEPVDRLVGAVLRTLWDAIFKEASAALTGDDVDAVHDMRVAIRRFRSALRIFQRHLPPDECERLIKRTRRLGRGLGAVRDADVHLEVLRGALAQAADAEREGIAFAIEQIGETRGAALITFADRLSAFDRNALPDMLADV